MGDEHDYPDQSAIPRSQEVLNAEFSDIFEANWTLQDQARVLVENTRTPGQITADRLFAARALESRIRSERRRLQPEKPEIETRINRVTKLAKKLGKRAIDSAVRVGHIRAW